MHLFDNLDSGNGYKVRLLLAQLGLRYDWTELDIDAGATRTPEFLKRNPNGRIPTLELDDGTNLAESNAILWYLAEGTAFVPGDRLGRAQALQWMFFEQYSHEPFVATPRYIVKHLPPEHARRAELARAARERPRRARDHGRASCSRGVSSPPSATRSRTSRSTPTRTSRTKAATISRRTRACGPGSRVSRRSPSTSAFTRVPAPDGRAYVLD